MDKKAFTLVEAALAAALAAIVGVVIFATFSSGLRLWQRRQEGASVRSVALLFERMQRDIENGCPYGTWALRGNATQFEFPSLAGYLSTPWGQAPAPGRILYVWDAETGKVLRSVASVAEEKEGTFKAAQDVLSGVERFTLSYYYLQRPQKEYVWSEQWPPEQANVKEGAWPLAVRLEATLREDKKTYDVVKIFSLSLGE